MINILINGKEDTVTADTTLLTLLTNRYGPQLKGVAVALNGRLAHRSNWTNIILQEADSLEVLRAVAGG